MSFFVSFVNETDILQLVRKVNLFNLTVHHYVDCYYFKTIHLSVITTDVLIVRSGIPLW